MFFVFCCVTTVFVIMFSYPAIVRQTTFTHRYSKASDMRELNTVDISDKQVSKNKKFIITKNLLWSHIL